MAQRTCGAMDYLDHQIQMDPQRAVTLDQIEQFTQQYMQQAENGVAKVAVTIPVVVHVIWRTTAENITDAKVQAQISQLNLDFARMNSDAGNTPAAFASLGVNTQVQFCLAQRDPNGAATTGIVRRQTTVTSFSDNDAVKFTANGGDNAWPAASYLNLWVCNLGGGLLGYAQFPGGSASTDGVVVLYSSVGSMTNPGTATPYHLGRTATHEVGHWLNLRHIWGDANCGNDLVSDTPTQQTDNGGCPSFPHVTCSNGPNGDMFMNYMDYTNDACMNIFTNGQSTRMSALFSTGGSRVSLLSSLGCQPPSGATCNAPAGLAAGSMTTTGATLSWSAAANAISYNVQYKLNTASTWTTVNTTATSLALTGLASATSYNAQVQTVCSSGSSAYSSAITFTTSTTGGCADALEPNNSTGAAGVITLPATINALIASSTDADHYRFTLSATSNVSISMTNLAGDYDLRLLNSGGTQLAISQNGSTTSESISYSNAAAGTYYVHVFGYNGAFSATQCYALNVSATAVPTGCTDSWEANNSSAAASTIAVNTNISGAIGSSTDVDWFKFNNTSAAPKIRVNLSNLAGDYDVRLYRGTTTQVGISQNGGTTAEQIILNTTTVATYYIQVYGYNGAFSTSQCYTLRANTQSANFRIGDLDASELELEPAYGLLNLFPNPTTDKVNLEYLAEQDGTLGITLIDQTGRTVATSQLVVAQGPNTYGLPLPQLADGMYMLTIQDGDRIQQQRFVVRH